MPGLVNDFMQLPPEQKQQLLRYAGNALGARGGDINNVATKLLANPALAMQMMERSGIGVANPIGGAAGDRAWEPDFASTVARSLQNEASSAPSAPAPNKSSPSNGAQGSSTNPSQRTRSSGGGGNPARSGPTAERTLAGGQQDERFQGPRVASIQTQPPTRPSEFGAPATSRPGDGGMGAGTLIGGGIAGLAALEGARRYQQSRRNPAMVRDAKLINTKGGPPELTTMDEVMGPPQQVKSAAEDTRNDYKRRFTEGGDDDATARQPHGGEVDDYVPRNRVDQTFDEEPTSGHKAPQRDVEAKAGPSPVDTGNAPPGKEASDLATYEDVTGDDKATKEVDKSKRDPAGYEKSQTPSDQVEYGKPKKGAKVRTGKFKPNVRFK